MYIDEGISVSKKVLVLSGSPRKGGNSDTLCNEFIKGAQEAGHNVEKINIAEKKIEYCNACYYCQRSGGFCPKKDDMVIILDKIISSDVIVMASPVYFYSINAQMKALIDRCVAKWLGIKDKEFYYIMSAAEDSPTVTDCALECFRGFASCLDGSKEMGVISAIGVYESEDVRHTIFMEQAYEMGKRV